MFESIVQEVTQKKFYGKRTLTIISRKGVLQIAEIEAKDTFTLTE